MKIVVKDSMKYKSIPRQEVIVLCPDHTFIIRTCQLFAFIHLFLPLQDACRRVNQSQMCKALRYSGKSLYEPLNRQ